MKNNKKSLNDKICAVLHILYKNEQEFKSVGESIDDLDLKGYILVMVEKDSEFVHQLITALNHLEVSGCQEFKNIPGNNDWKNIREDCMFRNGNLMDEFSRSENVFETTYRAVLNSWFCQDELRNMMMRQLNEIKCTFLKLKMRYLTMNHLMFPYPLYMNG